MITPVKEILTGAQSAGYAVGVFNTFNLETARGILEGAQEMQSPVILQVTEKTFDYAGGRATFQLLKTLAECYFNDIPVGIHLDHGKSFEIVQRAVEIGFTSVMYDGSRRSYADNLAMTERIVEFCHSKNVCAQAELGSVPYLGEAAMQEVNWDGYMTDPDQAQEFVEKTGLDVLAVAIGNAHGFFRERPVPDYARLEAIRARVHVPLLLHGASDWEKDRVAEVIKRGIIAFNTDTAIRLAFLGQLSQSLQGSDETDPRKILGDAKEAVKRVVKEKITMFGSTNKV